MTKPSTRRLSAADAEGEDSLLTRFRAAIVLLSGDLAGSEYELASTRTLIGRGPEVDLAFDDSSMSRQHAAIEIDDPGGILTQKPGRHETRYGKSKHGSSIDFELGDRRELGCGLGRFAGQIARRREVEYQP